MSLPSEHPCFWNKFTKDDIDFLGMMVRSWWSDILPLRILSYILQFISASEKGGE